MTETEKKDRKKGLITSFVLHTLFFVFFAFMVFGNGDEGLDELGGIEVSLGEPDYGGPDNTPAETNPETQPESSSEDTEPQVITNQQDEAPEVVKQEKKKETKKTESTTKKTTTEKKKEQPKVDQESMFPGSKNSSGKGNGTKSGNEGKKDGKPDGQPDGTGGSGGGPDGVGSGSGGTGWSLSGRKAISQAKPSGFTKSGTVRVQITVSPDGKVIAAKAVLDGSTTTNSSLWRLSESTALKWRFDRSNRTNNQQGYITFVYKKS